MKKDLIILLWLAAMSFACSGTAAQRINTDVAKTAQTNTDSPKNSQPQTTKANDNANDLSQREEEKTKCQTAKFNTRKYAESDDIYRIFKDKQISKALRKLLLKDYSLLIANLDNVTSFDQSLEYVDANGTLGITGFARGLGTVSEAILMIEPCGNIFVGILKNGREVLYFTNNRESSESLPPQFEKWRTRFPDVPIVYQSK